MKTTIQKIMIAVVLTAGISLSVSANSLTPSMATDTGKMAKKKMDKMSKDKMAKDKMDKKMDKKMDSKMDSKMSGSKM